MDKGKRYKTEVNGEMLEKFTYYLKYHGIPFTISKNKKELKKAIIKLAPLQP